MLSFFLTLAILGEHRRVCVIHSPGFRGASHAPHKYAVVP